MSEPYCLRPEDYPRALNVVGEKITVLASKAVANGFEIYLQDGPEGSGPPPHQHPWDEAFFIISGAVEFTYDGRPPSVARAGTLVHLPAGTTHSFRFVEAGKMLSVTGNKSEATNLFTEIDAEIPADAHDVERLLAVAQRNGLMMKPYASAE